MDTQSLKDKLMFMSVGYICSGSLIAILASIQFYASFFSQEQTFFAALVAVFWVLFSAVSILLIRYLVPKYGAKAIYEHDILVLMIGILFISLALNIAMYFVGLLIFFGALAVFFYENFNRQVAVARAGSNECLSLCSWAIGPIVAMLVIIIFSFTDYSLLATRILFAHYIALGFWLWIQRLDRHESYYDAPTVLISTPQDETTDGKTKADEEEPK